jgi:hypothetical protein
VTLLNQELIRIIPSSLLKENYSKICTIILLTVKVVRSKDIHCVRKVEGILCGVLPSVYLLTLVALQNFFDDLFLCSVSSEKMVLVLEILKAMNIKHCGLLVTEKV